jgi:hypothetical protein
MNVFVTKEALAEIRRRGGAAAIDFVPPIG